MFKKLFLNDNFILLLIVLNTITLFLNGYCNSVNCHTLSFIDNTITLLFILELILKNKVNGINNYFKSNWNKLDFVLVILSLPSFIAFILQLNLIDFSFLLVFRVLRVFKTFRFLKFIPNIGELVSGVQRALKASLIVFLGFFLYIVIIGILSFYIFNRSGSEYFSNPIISLYSTFKIFTVEGWFEIPEQLINNYSETGSFFTYLYFIFVVLTGGVFGLSLINSIFVDSMLSDNNDDLEAKIDQLDSKINDVLIKLDNHETGKNT